MTRESAWKPVYSNREETKIDYNVTELIVNEVYGTKYQFLGDSALERISETNEYYRYYDLEGQYWSPPHNIGYDATVLPVNLARWFVRKRSGWLFGSAPDIECPSKQKDSTEEMEKVGYEPSDKQKKADKKASDNEQYLYSVWGENLLEEKLHDAAKDFYVGGTVALKIRYLPGRGIRLNFSPCQEVFPVPDPDDPDVLKAVHFASFFDNDETIWKQTWEMVGDKCLLTEGYYDLKLQPIGELKYNRVYTKLDYIPVLVFPRDRLSGDIFGTSYLKDLIPLFDQYNRVLSDAADSLRFNLFAITVLLNGVPDAEKQLTISPGAIWNISGDGVDTKKLESSFQYATALADFMTRLENLMHLLADVPDITPDRIKGFGLVSGVALKLLYSDLISATAQDWRIWKSRLVRTNEYIFRMADSFGLYHSGGDYNNRIIPHLPLPENEVEKVQMEAQKLGASMQSVVGALTELGEKNPVRKFAEILTEKEKIGQLYQQPEGNNNGEEVKKPENTSIR